MNLAHTVRFNFKPIGRCHLHGQSCTIGLRLMRPPIARLYGGNSAPARNTRCHAISIYLG
jgi:hypothetical protein